MILNIKIQIKHHHHDHDHDHELFPSVSEHDGWGSGDGEGGALRNRSHRRRILHSHIERESYNLGACEEGLDAHGWALRERSPYLRGHWRLPLVHPVRVGWPGYLQGQMGVRGRWRVMVLHNAD